MLFSTSAVVFSAWEEGMSLLQHNKSGGTELRNLNIERAYTYELKDVQTNTVASTPQKHCRCRLIPCMWSCVLTLMPGIH